MQTPITRFHDALPQFAPHSFSTAESVVLTSAAGDELYVAIQHRSDWPQLKSLLDSVMKFPVGVIPAFDREYSTIQLRLTDLGKLTAILSRQEAMAS